MGGHPVDVGLLAAVKDRRSIPLLRQALGVTNDATIQAAVQGLAWLNDTESIPLIAANLRRFPPLIAQSIAAVLAEFDDPRVPPLLDRFVTDEEGRAQLIGPVRQELLSGIREAAQYERLREHLRGFPDVPIETTDFEHAARFGNQCRAAGVTGSLADFLICAIAIQRKWPIFTTDHDFRGYAKILPIAPCPAQVTVLT